MTEQEINLLARYYCQPIERYISLKKQLNNLSGFSKKLSYYNYSLSNDLIGKTKTLKQLINQAISEIPYYIDFDIIVKAYKKLPSEVKNKPIDNDLVDSLDRILKREELMNKLPKIDRKFKFSYLSIIYKVIGVDITVQVSKTFFSWIVGTQGKVKIKSPAKVLSEFTDFVKVIKDIY